MGPDTQSDHGARRPIPSLFIGAFLLLFSGVTLLLRRCCPDLVGRDNFLADPSGIALLFTLLSGLYLLACLQSKARWRRLQQRATASIMLFTSAVLLYPALRGLSLPLGIELPALDALIAFLVAGTAALLNPSVRTLSQLAAIFLLILLMATLAILGVINHVLEYDLFFAWRLTRHMSPITALGLLIFAAGLAYTSWWCHRKRLVDPVSGITLVASLLLIFSALLGAGLIYAVAVSHLHEEIRNDLTTLLKERSASITTQLRHGQEFSQLLIQEAGYSPRGAAGHQLDTDYALRISNSDGSVVAVRNGDWFEQKTISSINRGQMTLWRGEQGHCQLRITQQSTERVIETSVPLDLGPILNASKDNRVTDDLILCAFLPDDSLHCLAHGEMTAPEIPKVLASGGVRFRSGGITILRGNDAVQAIMPIPEFRLVAYMEKSHRAIIGPLYQRLYLVLPLAVMLLAASVGLIAWRIHPLAKQLHRSEQRYRTLVDGAADAIILHDENRRFIETNPAASAMLGYSRNELIGMHPDDFLDSDDRADALQQLQRLKSDGTAINTRRQLRRKDGTLATVEIRATRLDSGMTISVVRDISEQMKIEAALNEKERFIRSVVEVLAEGVVVHQSDGDVIYTNRAALHILGHATLIDVSIHDPSWSFVHDDNSPFEPDDHPAMQALHHGISQRDIVMGVLRPDGNRIWLSVNSDPLWDEQSHSVIGAVVSFSDITQKRATEQLLTLKRERLRALSSHLIEVREEEKAAIAREIHDELGSSLTAIKMGIEWIDEKMVEQSPEMEERIIHITNVTAQAIKATRQLVSQLRPSVLEDLGLWAALEWLIREFCSHRNISCRQNLQCGHINLPPQTSLVIYRIVQEALTNIAKHAQASAVRIDCWHIDGHLTITVEDNGVGIDDEATHRITSYGIRGMYERIDQINGKLQLLGSPGEGTLVVLSIPIEDSTEAHLND